ncbi:ribonuclease HII [Candidatus Pacebacteria bacterium]|nr:ribonuclease HII [Candidatus Paceibacterota bacterium]
MPKYVIGIDEAGRGPLAGPVAVGVAQVPADFDWALLPGVTDSKKLSERKREEIFAAAKKLSSSNVLTFNVALVSALIIDRIGIVRAIERGMVRALSKVSPEGGGEASRGPTSGEAADVQVKLDGGLRAPERFTDQETIIKGDQREQIIGLASIVAKVTRDQHMCRLGAQPAYAPYDFATHKGYATQKHREAISNYGLSPVHRTTYCKNVKVL